MDKMKKGGGGMETTTLAEVPMGERKSWIDVAMIQAGIMICVSQSDAGRYACGGDVL